MKEAYVRIVRTARRFAERSGLLSRLENSEKRSFQWLRSQFGIYDSADLVHLDVPWWTYSAIDEVKSFLAALRGEASIYEYGSGASTVWLAKRSASVNSVEHDIPFATSMSEIFGCYPNISVQLIEPVEAVGGSGVRSNRKGYTTMAFDNYVASIDKVDGLFDLIVIDGRARLACLRQSIPRLAPGGIILFDNSNRHEYRSGIEACGLREIVMRGMAPALPMPSQTSILTART